MKTWRYDAGEQTLALVSTGGLPQIMHWGARLPENEDLAALYALSRPDVTGGMMDKTAPLTVCPLPRDGWMGQPGLVAYRDGQLLNPRFRNPAQPDGPGIRAEDPDLGLSYTLHVVAQDGLISVFAQLESAQDITVHWFAAPVLPAPQHGDILDFHGRWIGEFQTSRTPWSPGIRLREARTGRSGHEHPPLAYFPGAGTTNTQGPAWAASFAWSGGHRMVAEELSDGRRQIQFGIASGADATGTTRLATQRLDLAFSEHGLNGCASALQRAIRRRAPDLSTRKVHYNCWEAIYFDHDLETLKDIATRAAALGAERFVLDDGWFGKRNDDTTSLGDWQIDRRKWPDGLTPLIDHVKAQGMDFGLWFEPEMVSPDSDLARAHPDWVLGPSDQPLGRQQWVLDLTKPEVRDHLFQTISALLSAYDIAYIKWDHNRLLPVVDAAQTRGLYALLDRLTKAHTVEIESCASGGGRIDAAILQTTNRVWLSDSNDALERLRIQHASALLLPAAVTGSHVGPRHCHTSGRTLPMTTRAWTAASRHMGFEMDPRELTDAEAATLKQVTTWWKANRTWLMQADILRLDPADPAIIAEQHLAADQSRFAVFAAQLQSSAQILPRPLRLTGLDPAARYRVTLLNPEDRPNLSRGPAALKDGPITASGQWLLHHGLILPWHAPQTLWVLEGERL